MKPQFTIDEVVPHAATMSLLDRVVAYDDESLTAEVTITPETLFLQPRGVPGWIGIEYMAQAIAAFAGVGRRLAGEEAKVGFLVGTRRYRCSSPFFPLGTTLRILVEREFQADNGLGAFSCRIEGGGIEASCTLNVFQPDDVEAFLNGDASPV